MPPLSATRSISTLLEQQHGQWLDWGKFGIRRNYQPNFVSFDQTAGSRKLAVVDASRSIGQNGLFADLRCKLSKGLVSYGNRCPQFQTTTIFLICEADKIAVLAFRRLF